MSVSPDYGYGPCTAEDLHGLSALAGIPQYWIVDLDPEPQLQLLRTTGGEARYGAPQVFIGSGTVAVDEPFPLSFAPPDLTDLTDFA